MEDFEENVPINPKSNKLQREVLSLFAIVFTILVFRSSFYEPYRIPSGSMIPTLKIGDYIIVNKFAYGLKYPFSDMAIGDINLNPSYVFKQEMPRRGDVIVFKYPKDPSTSYIKRVIGLPGDTIEIKDKIVFVNDQPMEMVETDATPFLKDMDEKFKKYKLNFFKVSVEKKHHFIQQDSDNYYLVNKDKITIPDGEIFVMGDNRDFSYDSRFWGTVPVEYVKGRAEMVWFSIVFPVDGGVFKFRPSRIGNSIE
ncbi:signal peptidase I [Halobacteriovorax marinus]|uniref:Signal peptidase I n=1 Tax=Halobacteriovorax marinus TaxID=97084 RepID=A0A1Y5F707_9BACT|nr:signal peptidase I [Halobacteriovorax marinus]